MQQRFHPQPVENYTSAFLVTFGVILFMTFWVIAAVAGFLWVALTATAIDSGFRWWGRHRS